jgi:prevent-host-death family protein
MGVRYSIAEARDKLAGIVHDVEEGEPVQLTRRGRPVAILLSVAEFERLSGRGASFVERLIWLRERERLDELGADLSVFEDTREREPGREFEW